MNYLVGGLGSSSFKKTAKRLYLLVFLAIAATSWVLQGCSGGDVAPAAPAATTAGSTLYLSVSKTTILADDSDSSILTATVLKSNVGQAGVIVTFAATGGQLNSTSATTGTDGKASVTVTSGPSAIDQIITITAQSDGSTKSIPIQISGNELSLTLPQTNMAIAASQPLSATLLNANLIGIANAAITYSIVSGADIINLSSSTATTNFAGQAEITVTAVKAGTAKIRASSMGVISEVDISVGTTSSSNSLKLSTSKTSILANDSDSSAITATVLKNNVGQAGVIVTFAADGGQLSATFATTGADGKATVNITSGPGADNQFINITAAIDGATTAVPLEITGNSLALSVQNNTMVLGTNQALSTNLRNGDSLGILNATVTYTVVSGADIVSLSSPNATTNSSGLANITVSAIKTGNALIQASSKGVTSQISISVATYSISLSVAKTSILTGDSDSSVITATVLNGNLGQADVNVNFSTTGGRLAATSAITGADGKASVNITSGVKAENKTIIITAEITGATASVPLQITGNQLSLSLPATNMVLGTDQPLTTTLLDGSSLGIAGATVSYTVISGTDVISLSKAAETTDAVGQALITVTALKNGSAIIAASSMGVTSQINVIVAAEGGYTIFLSTSKTSILTNDTDSAVITATAIKDSAVQAGVSITFSSTGGLLSATSGITGADGKTSVTITSGPRTDNQVIEITAASAGAAPYTVPLQITGNTLVLSIPQTNMAVGASQTLLATLKNAIPLAMANKDIAFVVESGADFITLSSPTGPTDVAGQTNITVTALQSGPATIAAIGGGVTARINVSITTEAFEITAPTEPADLLTSDTVGLEVTVRAPAPTTSVIFQSTIGGWNSVPGQSVLEVPVVAGLAHARLTSPNHAGLATVTVYDKNIPTTRDSIKVSIYAPDTEADNVDLQASQANVAVTPANSTSQNSVTLTATVKNNRTFPVGKAVVHFTLVDVTGGGEYLSTGMAITDSTGVATCTFYSGTLGSSGNGVKVVATVAETGKNDTAFITITDKAGSVTMTRANFILVDSGDQTKYIQKITAFVSNANGSPVANALISLNLWPTGYYLGYWGTDPLSGQTRPVRTPWPCSGLTAQPNEDVNRNLILDPGEDTGPMGTPNGFLTPANSYAGLVPATVTTDATGFVTFEITYPKGSAPWLEVELTATVSAQGSESQAKLNWGLEYLVSDVSGTLTPNDGSPFGYFIDSCPGDTPTPDSLKLSTSKTSILADDSDSSVITATVLKNNIGQAGVVVNFTTTAGQLSAASATTGADGKASVAITSGAGANNQTFRVTAAAAGLTSSIPLRITGNTLDLSIPQTTVTLGSVQTLTSTLQNAIPQGIGDATITYTVVSGADIVNLSSATGTTDFAGQASINVTAVKAGTAVIQASGMGVTAQITVNVETTNGYSVKLSTSKNSILANDSDNAVITATVLKNNVGQAGIVVTFAANGGQLSSTSATTGADGKASVAITSGTGADNQSINITATIDGATTTLPLEISGNTLALSVPSTTMALGTNQALSATLRNAVPLGIANATITYTVISGADIVSLSSATSMTNATGQANIAVSALQAGTALIEASSKGVTSQISISVETTTGYSLKISTSKTSILANDSDGAVITATVLKNNVGQAGIIVAFASDGGQLSSASATTGPDGKASVTITSGAGAANQTLNVSANIAGATASIPLQVTGNSLFLSIPQNNMAVGASQALTATLQNAVPLGIAGATITFTVVSGADVVGLSSATGTTNSVGQTNINLTALQAGTAVIQASGMGVTSQISVSVEAYSLNVSVSKTSILSGDIDSSIVTATVLSGNVGQAGVNVTFSTTNGGRLTSNSAITGADGKASVNITSGPGAANKTVIITAVISGATATVPLQITGNQLLLSLPQTNMVLGTSQTLTTTLQDGAALGIAGATVIYTVVSGADVISLSNATKTTDAIGQALITVTAVKNGTALIEASSMGTTTQISVIVASEGGYVIFLSTSKTSILSNDGDSAVITATVIKDSVVQAGVNITFTANGGLLSASSGTSGADGKTSVTITSGPKTSNQLISVSAASNGVTTSIPLQVTGNTLTLSIPQTNVAVGSSQTLTATLQNAIPLGIADAAITFTVESGSANISLSSSAGTTNFAGQYNIIVTALQGGTATIMAEGMGAISRINLNVTTEAFEITNPDPDNLTTSDFIGLPITVNVPLPTTTVVFNTTIGSFDVAEVAPSVDPVTLRRTATAHLTSQTAAGLATVTVFDKDLPNTQDSIKVNIFAPDTEADNVTLQASQVNVAITPASSPSKNSVTLTATVKNINNFPVGEAIVYFTLSEVTGGGEYLSTGMTITNSAGVAICTFYSGTLGSSGSGVKITATVAANPTKTDSVNITIRDLAGSIVMGRSNKISIGSANTTYSQNITAQVSDANGNAVPNAIISLNLWPTHYFLGAETFDRSGTCTGYYYNSVDYQCSGNTAQPNEDDVNRNLILDPGEDVGPTLHFTLTGLMDGMTGDGFLTPANSAAGSVPATVTTDATGLATFDINYLKRYAMWLAVELTATTKVQGTETQAKMEWVLAAEEGEYNACDLFASPFGAYVEKCVGSILVSVINKTTLAPISGANVTAGSSSSCKTGSDGTCTMNQVPIGLQTVTASHIDYSPASVEVTVPYANTVSVEINLSPM